MLDTVNVSCRVHSPEGTPISGAVVTARLSALEIHAGYVLPEKVVGITNNEGIAVLKLWPNEFGAVESHYKVTLSNPTTGRAEFITATIPNFDCDLHLVANLPAYEGKTEGQLILDAAVAAGETAIVQAAIATEKAEEASLSATNAEASNISAIAAKDAAIVAQGIAEASAVATQQGAIATAADRVQTGLDRTQTGLDRVQTGLDREATAADRVQTGIDSQSASDSKDVAIAQAIAASSSASNANLSAIAAQNSSNSAYDSSVIATAKALEATEQAAIATASQGSASASAFEAGTYADSALASKNAASVSETNALNSANAAYTSSVNAANSETAAANSESNASISEINAANSESAANLSAISAEYYSGSSASSAAIATAQATIANTKAGEASGSAAQALAIYGNTAAMQTAVNNAQSAASLAAGHAASASSVVQQDLSGVSAAALHRSPNAVTSMFVYDTSKDSDGGAWTEKCQHTSWFNESLNGKWLGAQASETAARAISGATTGDYFQATTDGKFYKLNATSGTAEVFRGNKAKFPKLAAIVAEASRVTIYDLTEPGRPMWMRFSSESGLSMAPGGAIPAMSALNGLLVTGSSTTYGPLHVIDFPLDKGRAHRGIPSGNGSEGWYKGTIAKRNANLAFSNTSDGNAVAKLVADSVNAVAMTVLPDAPVDPVTGLQVPTIAVGTAGGVSVIKQDGSVSSHAYTWITRDFVTIRNGYLLYSTGISDHYLRYIKLSDITGPTFYGYGFSATVAKIGTDLDAQDLCGGVNTVLVGRYRGSSRVSLSRLNPASRYATVGSHITNLYNTGYLLGDIRRAYLSDITAERVSGTELVTNGTFDTDISGWTAAGGASISWSNGALVGTSSVVNNVIATQTLSGLSAGKTYKAILVLTAATQGVAVRFNGSAWSKAYTGTVGTTVGFIVAQAASVVLEIVGGSGNSSCTVDSISLQEVVADRSYKAQAATIVGSLTKSVVAPGAQLVAYSGFSAANYLREPYSADLDFGTGEWSVGAWVNVPTTLPVESFPVIGSELLTNGDFSNGTTGWRLAATSPATVTVSGGVLTIVSPAGEGASADQTILTVGKWYAVTGSVTVRSGSVKIQMGSGAGGVGVYSFRSSTTFNLRLQCTGTDGSFFLARNANCDADFDNISVKELAPALITDRAYSSGTKVNLGVTYGGSFTATAYDGTTTRTVTTTAAYNTATWLKAEAVYKTDGSLAILVNGNEVAVTRGNPLLTLNNPDAVLTIGNSYALNAPFPGSLALLKFSATVPTAEQSQWMYEQEKQLFRDNAQCCLPDSGNLNHLSYDDATDKWIAISATNESEWSGLVRTNVKPVPAGSFSKLMATSGVKLEARTTTNPGVDITIPAYGLREELVKRAEAAAKLNAQLAVFDYVGGFTATTTNGSTSITSVAGLSYPVGYIGAQITGTGIASGTVVVGVSGTTLYLSKPATASGTAVQIRFTDFILPVGHEAKIVMLAGVGQKEGSTAAFTRLFDGFKETIRFGTAPAYNANITIQATRSVA